MKPQVFRVILIVASIALGGLRVALVASAPPIEFTFFNVFKDLAHLHFGVLLGVYVSMRMRSGKIPHPPGRDMPDRIARFLDRWNAFDKIQKSAFELSIGLLVIECVCAAVTLLSK